MSRPVSIAVDILGGDFAPQTVFEGVREALVRDHEVLLTLVGPVHDIEAFKAELPETQQQRVTLVNASQVIGMDEHPARAIRAKKDATIVVGSRLVKDGECDGFYSAGSTGACMAAATLVTGRIRGVNRPALATILPGTVSPTVLLDVGANADCKPDNLAQFAVLGSAYARAVLEIDTPRVALLNIGEEETKGSELAQAAHELLKNAPINFVGNVEGRDVLTTDVDVIVTDGFTGNVTLKLLEGTSKALLTQVKDALTSSPLKKVCAHPSIGALKELKANLDPEKYGGAPLLGVKGVCAIGHGSSRGRAVANGILTTAKAARANLTETMAATIEALAHEEAQDD